MKTSDKVRMFELTAVILTAIGKFIFMDWLDHRLFFISSIIIFWVTYVIIRNKRNGNILKYWGFRKDNFYQTVKLVLPFALISIISCVGIGIYNNTLNLSWHIFPILLTYPIWGTIQQFLLIGLVAGNLNHLFSDKLSKEVIILISAILFSIIHFPNIWLMIGTFFLALFYGFVYLKQKNLFVLGILHGWLGALFFYTVVNRDPLVEIFKHLS